MGEFAQAVLEGIARLRKADPQLRVFGAIGHRYAFAPRLSEPQIADAERRWRMSLPTEYREFLLEVGNGGAGPFYGIFPLGEWDGSGRGEPWDPASIGDPSKPFPHLDAWDGATGRTEPPEDEDSEEFDRWARADDERLFASGLSDGSIPICTQGCALRFLLVLNGPQAGTVWSDDRADQGGLSPLGLFAEWYLAWLEDALGEATSRA